MHNGQDEHGGRYSPPQQSLFPRFLDSQGCTARRLKTPRRRVRGRGIYVITSEGEMAGGQQVAVSCLVSSLAIIETGQGAQGQYVKPFLPWTSGSWHNPSVQLLRSRYQCGRAYLFLMVETHYVPLPASPRRLPSRPHRLRDRPRHGTKPIATSYKRYGNTEGGISTIHTTPRHPRAGGRCSARELYTHGLPAGRRTPHDEMVFAAAGGSSPSSSPAGERELVSRLYHSCRWVPYTAAKTAPGI